MTAKRSTKGTRKRILKKGSGPITSSKNGKSRKRKIQKPSKITSRYWLHAERRKGKYPDLTASFNGGKWLIFIPIQQIDEIWQRIKQATEDGKLGGAAKVSTAKLNPNTKNQNTKVICVYTYDWTDKQDVKRVREELRHLRITQKIPYKADEDTFLGKYANRGETRISKYYE